MAAPQGSIRVRQQDQALLVRVEGRATVAQGLCLRRFAEQCLACGPAALRVDLRHCTYMDSTFLGTLLFLKRAAERTGKTGLSLVCPSNHCQQLFRQMGVDDVFTTAEGEEADAADWTELSGSPDDFATFKRTVVQAHEELAGLSGPAGEPFREVVRCLRQAPDADKPS